MVSVIIPTYNRAKYIERAINSVLNQTYQDFELIVVDDNEPTSDARENMERIMQIYIDNPKIKYIKHPKNLNGAVARNTGISISKGEYITFLDDDDFFFRRRLEIFVEKLEKNKKYNAIYSSCCFFENDRLKKITYAEKEGNLQLDMLRQITFFGTGSNMFFRRKAIIEMQKFDSSFIRHQDIEFMVRYFENNLIIAEKEVLVAKCEEDKANFPNIDKAIIYKEHFLKKFKYIIDKSDNKDLIIHDNYFNLIKNSIRVKNYKKYKELKNKLKEETYFSIKDKFKIVFEFIDIYINISKIYRDLRMKKYKKVDIINSKKEFEFIKKVVLNSED